MNVTEFMSEAYDPKQGGFLKEVACKLKPRERPNSPGRGGTRNREYVEKIKHGKTTELWQWRNRRNFNWAELGVKRA